MLGTREIVLLLAALGLSLLGFVFPLRNFSKKLALRTLLFHALFAGVVLTEVALLERFKFFESRTFEQAYFGSFWIRVTVCVLSLDLLSYWWHRLNHNFGLLWKLHKFHHKTEFMDPLAAYRFHPVEVFLGYQLRAFVIWSLGFGVQELGMFILIYGTLNLFQHSNLRLPERFEQILSLILVTPRIHHMHHLRDKSSQNSNYATVFIFWDRLFGTYTAPGVIRENDIGLDWSQK